MWVVDGGCVHASALVVRGSLLLPSSPSPLPFVCCCCLSSSLLSVYVASSSSMMWQCSSTSWLHGLVIVIIIVCLRGLISGWVALSSSVFFVIVCLRGLVLVVNMAVQQHWLAGWPHCCCCHLASLLLSVCMALSSLSSPWLAAWACCRPMGVVVVFAMGDVVAVVIDAFTMEMSSSLPSSYGHCIVCRRAREDGKGGLWSWSCACVRAGG